MQFEIKSRWSGAVIFTADIEADEAANTIKAQAERIEALEEAIHDADQTLMLLGDTGWRKRHRAALTSGRRGDKKSQT